MLKLKGCGWEARVVRVVGDKRLVVYIMSEVYL